VVIALGTWQDNYDVCGPTGADTIMRTPVQSWVENIPTFQHLKTRNQAVSWNWTKLEVRKIAAKHPHKITIQQQYSI